MQGDDFARAESLYAQGDYEEALLAWENAEGNKPDGLNH
jgi:hypothetical protein